MLSVDRLPAQPPELAPSSPQPQVHGAVARAWAQATLLPLGHKPLVLPGGSSPGWWPSAFHAAEGLLPGHGASALEALLEPLRAYELRAEPDRRAVALITPVAAAGAAHLLVGQLTVEVAGKRTVGHGELLLERFDLHALELVHERLAALADKLTDGSLNAPDPDRKPPRALFVGELSKAEALDLRHDLWAHGVLLDEVLKSPSARVRPTIARVQASAGGLLLVALARSGPAGPSVLAAAPAGTRPILLVEREPDQLRLEWLMALQEHGVDQALAAREQEDDEQPEAVTWAQAAVEIEALECDTFLLTDQARAHLHGASAYPFPERARDALRTLAAIAADWAAKDGAVGGDFAQWALTTHQLKLSMHDKELVARKLHHLDFGGTRYSREPHVKVDDGVAFTDCGRIYFARDELAKRIIVDHIGLHPYRLKGWN